MIAHLHKRSVAYIFMYGLSTFVLIIIKLGSFSNYFADLLYAAIFFVSSLSFIFTKKQIVLDPLHSAQRHFEIKSRNQPFNYYFSAILVAAGFSFAIGNFQPGIIFLFWSLLCGLLLIFNKYHQQAITNQITDYLTEHIPSIERKILRLIVKMIMENCFSLASAEATLGLDKATLERVHQLTNTYLEHYYLP